MQSDISTELKDKLNTIILQMAEKAYKSIRFKQGRAVDIIVNTEHEFATHLRPEDARSHVLNMRFRRRGYCCMEIKSPISFRKIAN